MHLPEDVFIMDGRELSALESQHFNLESDLQTMLAECPNIIPGHQIQSGDGDPPRFVLLGTEVSLDGQSVDILLVDQFGVLTLVETKLLRNNESRREVLGQVIEYATRAIDAWGNGALRNRTESYWLARGRAFDDALAELSEENEGPDVEGFWMTVEANLKQGKVRLVIASDELHPQLRRSIEYLNGETRIAEVLGVEIRRYKLSDARWVVVPRVCGHLAQATREPRPPEIWPSERLAKLFEELEDEGQAGRLMRLLDWATGRGSFKMLKRQTPAFGIKTRHSQSLMTIEATGKVFCFLDPSYYPDGVEERDRLAEKLRSVRDLFQFDAGTVRNVKNGRYLSRKLDDFSNDEMDSLLVILDEFAWSAQS